MMKLVRMTALLVAQCAQPYENRIKIKLVIMSDATYHTTSHLTRKKYNQNMFPLHLGDDGLMKEIQRNTYK